MTSKTDEYQKELEKLNKIFESIEPDKRDLVQGLIQDAAFLLSENITLRSIIDRTGMIKVHPQYEDIQKPTEAAKQYLKNVNSYSVVIKTLSGILNKSIMEQDEDELGEYE